MPLNIRNEAVNELAERLAVRQSMNKTAAVRIALENELRRLDEAVPLGSPSSASGAGAQPAGYRPGSG